MEYRTSNGTTRCAKIKCPDVGLRSRVKFPRVHCAPGTGFLPGGMLQLPPLASSAYKEKNENAEAKMCFCMASRCIHRNLRFLRKSNIQGDF